MQASDTVGWEARWENVEELLTLAATMGEAHPGDDPVNLLNAFLEVAMKRNDKERSTSRRNDEGEKKKKEEEDEEEEDEEEDEERQKKNGVCADAAVQMKFGAKKYCIHSL